MLRSAKFVFIGSALLVSILIFSVQTTFTSYHFYNLLEQFVFANLQENMEHEEERLAAKFQQWSDMSRDAAELIASMPDYNTELLFAKMQLVLSREPLLQGVGFWLKPYENNTKEMYYGAYFYKAEPNEVRLSWEYSTPEYNYFQYDWYAMPVNSNRLYWTAPYLDEISGLKLITVSYPIHKQGRTVGVAAVDIKTIELEAELSALSNSISNSGYAFILDSAGHYFGNSNLGSQQTRNILLEDNLVLQQMGQKILTTSTSGMFSNAENVVVYAPIGNTGLKLVIVYPFKELYRNINDFLVVSLLVFLLALFLYGLLLVHFFNHQISHPLKALVAVTEEIGRGHWEVKIPCSKLKNEIGQLANAFTRMCSELKVIEVNEREAYQSLQEARDSYALLFYNIFDAMLVVENCYHNGQISDYKVVDINKAGEKLIGLPREQILGRNLDLILEYLNIDQTVLQQIIDCRQSTEFVSTLSELRYFRTKVVFASAKQLKIILYDITDMVIAEKQLREQNEYLQSLYEITLAIINHMPLQNLLEKILEKAAALVHAEHGTIVVYNPEADQVKITAAVGIYNNVPPDYLKIDQGLIGVVWQARKMLMVPDYSNWEKRMDYQGFKEFRSGVGVPLFNKDKLIGVFVLAYTNDELFDNTKLDFLERFSRLASLALVNAKLYVSLQQQLKQTKINEKKIKHLAYHNPILELPNRNLLNLKLTRYIEKLTISTPKEKFAVVTFAFEGLNLIYDVIGSEEGDKLLRQIAVGLRKLPGSFVAKLYGYEFAVVIPRQYGREQVKKYVISNIARMDKPWFVRDQEFYLTVNAGVAVYPADADNADMLLKNADIALRKSKEQGRNTYRFYSQELLVETLGRVKLEQKLRNAIEKNHFVLYYQPRIDLKTKKIAMLEVLVRWQDPQDGLIMPNKFIPLAEETGLIIPLGNLILHEACHQLKHWLDAGKNVKLSINLSAAQFRQKNLLATIKAILEHTDINPTDIELEITETMCMHDLDFTVHVLQELKQLGISVAMDDFGTGQSSLINLSKLPIDTLKIDKSFIDQLDNNSEHMLIVKTIITLSNLLKMKTTAEGVETQTQFDIVKALNCDEVQGYYFYKPMPAEEVEKILN